MDRDGIPLNSTQLRLNTSLNYYGGGQINYALIGNKALPMSLINPFAWAMFIQSIKNGAYKKMKEE
jgi:hypothetical protein